MFEQAKVKDKDIKDRAEKEAAAKENSFSKRWGWLSTIHDLSGNDLFLREKWLQTSVKFFFNHLTMIKEKNQIGDLILPIAAIRGEGTSNDYFPPEVPALPAFSLQKAVSTAIRNHGRDYWTGTVYTTNRRIWEHDDEFKNYLRNIRAMAVDMETATIFSTGFFNDIPTGALLLISDQPMTPDGVKTAESDERVNQDFVNEHIRIGIDALLELIDNGLTVKHLRFEFD